MNLHSIKIAFLALLFRIILEAIFSLIDLFASKASKYLGIPPKFHKRLAYLHCCNRERSGCFPNNQMVLFQVLQFGDHAMGFFFP